MRDTDTVDPTTPCIVGTARHTWHDADPQREPLDMWADATAACLDDAADGADVAATAVRRAIDDLGLVHCQSWYYDDPITRCADRLGVADGHRQQSLLAGTSPQRLLDSAAVRMRDGATSVALVVGGEAFATAAVLRRSGAAPDWSFPHPSPPALPIDIDRWYLPTEIAHGVLPAWLTFALLGQARWAQRGGRDDDRARMAARIARFSEVAASHPEAWFRNALTAEEFATPTAANRPIATPYTKWMTAFMDVDMASASLMVTHETADAWGVPPERRVYLRGFGFARDAVHVGNRASLHSSPAMRAATTAALDTASMTLDDVDVIDLYSCFPAAVEFAIDALGVDDDDPRGLTVTGGLARYGGPSSNYMGHSISHVVDRLRDTDAEHALVTGVGMHMTKHVAAVWSTRPGRLSAELVDEPQSWFGPEGGSPGERPVTAEATGEGAVVSASVVHDFAGAEPRVVAICELDDGSRCYATSRADDVVDAVASGAWVGATAKLVHDGSVNELHL